MGTHQPHRRLHLATHQQDQARQIQASTALDKTLASDISLFHKPPLNNLIPTAFQLPWYVPCFKYLRKLGSLNDDGTLRADAEVPDRIRKRVESVNKNLATKVLKNDRTVAELLSAEGRDEIFKEPWNIPAQTSDIEGLHELLLDSMNMRQYTWWTTQYAKVAVVYDWMLYAKTKEEQK
ncbi:hypothetical protein, partial [Neomicrococcus lactis]|uniref:hypothetical protein n=1 Tax=Neomicrococcus lactis TaxID=732241 RepID=UPI002300F41E